MKFPSLLRVFILTAATPLLTDPVSAGPLDVYRGENRLIDAMPMRRAEIQDQQKRR
jgi:hypothetical protein